METINNEEEKEELQNEIEELKEELEKLENNENEEEYDDMLDSGGEIDVCGMKFNASRILKELDPIAYCCGMSDYNDNRILELQDEIEEKEEELTNLNKNI